LEGFFLGLASGTVCLAYCSPVLLPYLMTSGRGTSGNFFGMLFFLLGRLGGYLVFAVIAWQAGWLWTLNSSPSSKPAVLGSVYILLALALLGYTFSHQETPCAATSFSSKFAMTFREKHWIAPVVLGLLTGLNLCPPLLLAFTSASTLESIFDSLFFFLMFFLGSSLYFLPLPLIGAFREKDILRTVGKFTSVIVGLFYLYTGLIELIGGYLLL